MQSRNWPGAGCAGNCFRGRPRSGALPQCGPGGASPARDRRRRRAVRHRADGRSAALCARHVSGPHRSEGSRQTGRTSSARRSIRLLRWPRRSMAARSSPGSPACRRRIAEYRRLKKALAHYRELVAQGGWPAVPDVQKIELEAGNPELTALQARLAVEDPQIVGQCANRRSPALEDAVKRFQARNGLKVDGVVGGATIAALNIPASERLDQIKANMERWRWLPHEFPAALYRGQYGRDDAQGRGQGGKVVLTSRVITGKKTTPTPIFNTEGRRGHGQSVLARAASIVAQRNYCPSCAAIPAILPASYGHGGQPVSDSAAAGRGQCAGLYQAGDAESVFVLSPRYRVAPPVCAATNVI